MGQGNTRDCEFEVFGLYCCTLEVDCIVSASVKDNIFVSVISFFFSCGWKLMYFDVIVFMFDTLLWSIVAYWWFPGKTDTKLGGKCWIIKGERSKVLQRMSEIHVCLRLCVSKLFLNYSLRREFRVYIL